MVRLIRSKGVSVWFITQNPSDIPDSVLGQIGNRIQHALRAYTPNDQKALRAAAKSFRVNENFDTEEVLQALGVGEALVSVLDEKGIPTVVERANILPPHSSMNAVEPTMMLSVTAQGTLRQKYSKTEDRDSAYEALQEKQKEAEELAKKEAEKKEKEEKAKEKEKAKKAKSSGRKKQSALEKTINSAANTIGRELGKKIVRGILGSFLK